MRIRWVTYREAAWKDTQADRVVPGQAQTSRVENKRQPVWVLFVVEAAGNQFQIAGVNPGLPVPKRLARTEFGKGYPAVEPFMRALE
jgi:hypothetical protein